jgi:hypothetical protein
VTVLYFDCHFLEMDQTKQIMNPTCRIVRVVSVVIAAIASLGCSNGPTAVEVPAIESETAATEAMTLYDKNGDGFLASDELSSCPSLQNAARKPRVDKDHDQRLSKGELVERLETWTNGGVGVSYLACNVTKGGRPLDGALIKLIPETFLGEVIQPAEGTTDASGSAMLGIDKSNLPEALQNLRGVQQGLYRVEITHPSVQLPSKYNSATTLGLEVSFDDGGYMVSFKL